MKIFPRLRLEALLFPVFILGACDSLLEVDPPSSKVPYVQVFSDDAMAESAVVGIYIDLYSASSFAGGGNESVVSVGGLSADELTNNPQQDPRYLDFERNSINSNNANLVSLWGSMYKCVYEANSVLEGLAVSTGLTTSVRDRLQGEALFLRAFSYFYLVNLFGPVPLILNTDYKINAHLARSSERNIYNQILTDLTAADDLLLDGNNFQDRIRASKSATNALLSRVYLYIGDWPRADEKATKVISKKDTYVLSPNPDGVFLSDSKEAIWQLRPYDNASYTNEGYMFSVEFAAGFNVLREEVVTSLEDGDRRRVFWIKNITTNGKMLYLPYKYKRYQLGTLTNEYSMVLRLAEVYLIRAEAFARQDKLEAAILDLDEIRGRAGLPLIREVSPGIGKAELLAAIERERRAEFLAEWGHRWLDLKRWTRANDVLSKIKPGWSDNDLLYPVPESEIRNNQNLEPQNQGY